MTKLARRTTPRKLLLASLLLSCPLLASACVFGSGSSDETPTPTATQIERPAISRSGPTPTETPFGGPAPRPTAAPATPQPARAPVDGLVSVVYSYPFVWPVQGPITSFMSPEHPAGIDIGLEANQSWDIRAAAAGTVTHAGGDDSQPLGISVVIDHGNGVTTTYGHLSELKVKEGDEVEVGQVIGIGGTTGESTGPHLHFEVRKDGDTVDPLHVLPTEDGDTAAFNIDCATTPFTLPSGSEALVDFAGILTDSEQVVAVDAAPLNGGQALKTTVANRTEVNLSSPIDFHGPNGLDSYDLDVTVDNGTGNQVLTCAFVVQRKDVPTTFYVRANPPASGVETPTDAAAAGPTSEPTPEATPTPNQWAGTPNYGISASSGSGGSGSVQTPSYGISSDGGGGAKPPSYGIPAAGATPTP